MRLSPWVFTSIITAATAADIQVNYYSDGGCADYMLAIHPSTDFACYDYQWTGSNSVNIASTTFPNGDTVCTFYTQSGCSGASQTIVYPNNNCASNYGHGFESMKCGISHDFWSQTRQNGRAIEIPGSERTGFSLLGSSGRSWKSGLEGSYRFTEASSRGLALRHRRCLFSNLVLRGIYCSLIDRDGTDLEVLSV